MENKNAKKSENWFKRFWAKMTKKDSKKATTKKPVDKPETPVEKKEN